MSPASKEAVIKDTVYELRLEEHIVMQYLRQWQNETVKNSKFGSTTCHANN